MKTIKLLMTAALLQTLVACAATRTTESAGEVVDDSTITTRVKTALVEDPTTKAREISVKTYRGVVQLSGFVDTNAERMEATNVARNVSGVKSVKNDLDVDTHDRTVAEAVDDSVLTAKAKTALIGNPTTKAYQIKVETKDGVVQLSGFVDSEQERATAADVVKSVRGVKSVDNDLRLKPAP